MKLQSLRGFRDILPDEGARWQRILDAARSAAEAYCYRQIQLLEIDTWNLTALTSDRVNSFDPAWDPQGHWLYFLSDRNLRSAVGSPWGPRQPEPYFDREMKLYALALQAGTLRLNYSTGAGYPQVVPTAINATTFGTEMKATPKSMTSNE